MPPFEKIFEPIQVGSMTVANRIVETTYSINSGRADGLPDDSFIEHHVQRARGGAAWIGSETWVLPTPLPPGRVAEIYNVGSSFAPRFMAEATQHGANVGRLI